MGIAQSRTARHQRIVELLQRVDVHSQAELSSRLAENGHAVTQATLSRDLVELGAVKVRRGRGLVYAVPAEGGDMRPRPPEGAGELDARLRRLCEELLVTAEASANLVVLRTPPGAANYLASGIDRTSVSVAGGIIGTVAGDDTVLVVAADPVGGAEVVRQFLSLAGGGGAEPAAGSGHPPTDAGIDVETDPTARSGAPQAAPDVETKERDS